MMQRVYLAGLSWTEESGQPEGIRLRWSYPFDVFGFPRVIDIERVKIDYDYKEEDKAFYIPPHWWEKQGDVDLDLWYAYHLAEPMQGIAFRYGRDGYSNGSKALVEVYDSRDNLIEERKVKAGDYIRVYGTDIQKIKVLPHNNFNNLDNRLYDLYLLDMFKDHIGSGWKRIAKIEAKETLSSSLSSIEARYGDVTIGEEDWEEFKVLANQAQSSSPDDTEEGGISKWEELSLLLSSRWEFSVLFGQGFYDGRRDAYLTIDSYNREEILSHEDGHFYAYRISIEGYRSNMVICRAKRIERITPPSSLTLDHCKVRFNVEEQSFSASYHLATQHSSKYARAIEVEEENSGSLLLGTERQKRRYFNQNKIVNNQTKLQHSMAVSFHDEKIRCRVRSIDGWDRVSAYTNWIAWRRLSFHHFPEVPLLEKVKYKDGQVTITRKQGIQNSGDASYDYRWRPDIVVKHDSSAKILVYRKKMGESGEPKVQTITITKIKLLKIEENGMAHYKVSILENLDLTCFKNGFLSQASSFFKTRVERINGNHIYFKSYNDELCHPALAKLQQDINHLDLWEEIAQFDPLVLPVEMQFVDNLPEPKEQLALLSYQLRLRCLGEIGLASNRVQDFRIPATPQTPPPFEVATLGTDFYNRTMVKIKLKNHMSGSYSIWWAEGNIDNIEEFKAKAVVGELASQEVSQGVYLYDVLSLPIRYNSSHPRAITIGIRRVNMGGDSSAFQIVNFEFSGQPKYSLV